MYEALVSRSREFPDTRATTPAVIVAVVSGLPAAVKLHPVGVCPVTPNVNKGPMVPSATVFVPDTSAPLAVVSVSPVQPVTAVPS